MPTESAQEALDLSGGTLSSDTTRLQVRTVGERLTGAELGRIDRFANGRLRRWVAVPVAHPLAAIVLSLGVLLASLSVLSSGVVRFVFFPEIEGNFISASLEMPERPPPPAPSPSRAASPTPSPAPPRLAEDVDASPEETVAAIAVTVATAASEGDPDASHTRPSNVATVEVKVQDAETRTFSATRFSNLWREAVGEIAGARILNISGSVVGVGADIALQVAAEDADTRNAAVEAIREALSWRQGVYAIRDSQSATGQEITVTLSDEGEALGVPLATLASEVRAAVYGAIATEVQRDREEVEVRVRLPEEERQTLADLADYRIPVGDRFVPLHAVAELSYAPASNTITRIDGRRVVTVEADVDDAATTGSAEVQHVIDEVGSGGGLPGPLRHARRRAGGAAPLRPCPRAELRSGALRDLRPPRAGVPVVRSACFSSCRSGSAAPCSATRFSGWT